MDHAKIAKCPVCLQLFTEPKVLNCGHSVCMKCIVATPRRTSLTVQQKITCLKCRQESSVPAGGFPTNLELQELVSSLESAKECGGCGRMTPKEELFRCTACEEEPGNAQSVAICGLCCVKDQHAHCFVHYNEATQRDVDEARRKIRADGTASQEKVDVVLELFPEMPQEVKQALKDRMQKHSELSAQLQVENFSKDDIAAKLADSQEHKAETERILKQMERIEKQIEHIRKEMTGKVDSCRRNQMKLVQKKGPVSQAAAARPAANRPSTSAATRAKPSSDAHAAAPDLSARTKTAPTLNANEGDGTTETIKQESQAQVARRGPALPTTSADAGTDSTYPQTEWGYTTPSPLNEALHKWTERNARLARAPLPGNKRARPSGSN